MDLIVSRNEFLRALSLMQGIADRRATMPILGNVLLRTEGKQRLLCASTDLNVSATLEVKASVSEGGGVTVGAKQLHDIVKGLPSDKVHMKSLENQRIEIRAGKAEFRVVSLSDRDFPKLPDPREVTLSPISAAVLREMISRSVYSSSTDETRPHLSGVCLEAVGGTARMVATDGHRLARIDREWKKGPEISPAVLIPRRGALEIKRLLDGVEGDVELGCEKGVIFVKAEDAVVSVKLSTVAFPPYEQVIPQDNNKTTTVNRQALLDCLHRISLVASDRTWAIKITLAEKELRVSGDNPDVGDAFEVIGTDYTGENLTAGFNAHYLIEALESMTSEQVRGDFGGDLDAVVFRPVSTDNQLAVVMPMRI